MQLDLTKRELLATILLLTYFEGHSTGNATLVAQTEGLLTSHPEVVKLLHRKVAKAMMPFSGESIDMTLTETT
jgi:hypothetical protein